MNVGQNTFEGFSPVLKSIAALLFVLLHHPAIVRHCTFIVERVACPATLFTVVSRTAVPVTAAFQFVFLDRRAPSRHGGSGDGGTLPPARRGRQRPERQPPAPPPREAAARSRCGWQPRAHAREGRLCRHFERRRCWRLWVRLRRCPRWGRRRC